MAYTLPGWFGARGVAAYELDEDGNVIGLLAPDDSVVMEFIDVGGDGTGTVVEV